MVAADIAITAYLKAYPDIVSLGARVLGQTPPALGLPWIRVTLIDDPATDGGIADHHVEAFMQFDCYAGKTTNTQKLASDLSLAVREALRVANAATIEGAVVTGARSTRFHQPDDDLGEPALERYVVSSTVWMHG
jgi:hypothetical protein